MPLNLYLLRVWAFFFLSIFFCRAGYGQTVLAPGDIVITGLNSNNPDEFAFAPMVDLAAGTQIIFTDNGWLATGSFRATEGTATYTVPAGGVPKGRVITFLQPTHPNFTATGNFELSVDGDQLLAYQGTSAAPRFICGLMTRGAWSDATSAQTSALPAGLQNGATAVAVGWSYAFMSQAALRRGLTATVRTSFNTASNWTGSNSNLSPRPVLPATDLILEGLVPDADELQALQELYTGTAGAGWTTRTNWPAALPWASTLSNVNFRIWYGVHETNGDVTSVSLANNHLVGPLAASLAKLQQLNALSLYNNQLSGDIPVALAQLPQLQALIVSQNKLTGFVPQGLMNLSQLLVLSVDNNQLTSMPDFSGSPAGRRANLSADFSNNAICFGPLEANFTAGQSILPNFNWAGQTMPVGEDVETQTTAEPLVLTCSFSGAHNAYQWQKRVGTTGNNWQAIAGAQNAVLRIATPALSDAGSYRCQIQNGWVTNLTLYTRTTTVQLTQATAQLPPDNPAQDLNRNWSIERNFDGNGNVIAESKQFTDGLGRPTQAQARNMANGHVFAAQTVYSSGGQPVLQTLVAPINNQSFRYQEHFVTATTTPTGGGSPVSNDYGPDNFEGTKAGNPDPLDEATTGTLGNYYSQQNQLEPLTPATHNPYSLVESYAGPWGGTKRAAAPGDEFRMGSNREGRSREFPLRTEFDNYVSLRPQFVTGSPLNTLQYQGLKTVSIDADGQESIVVTNKDGQTLVTCLSGTQYPTVDVYGFISADPTNTYDANAPAFQDVHIPAAGPAEVTFTVGDWVRIKNLQTGDSTDYEITPRGPSPGIKVTLQPGFYRFISLGGTQWFSYKAHYGNFSYTYYDDASRVVATVAPNGLGGNNVLRNPGFEQDQAGIANPIGWQNTTSPTGASYTESAQGGHGGSYYGVQWQPSGYTAYTYQVATNLPNGLYTLKAWVRSTGGQITAIMSAKHYDGTTSERQVAIPNAHEWEPWRQIELTDIAVTNGQCEVGFFSQTNVSAWILFDDVVLMRQPDATAPTFVTRNSYDTMSRLLSTESTDGGRAEYVYARDGRIRFSQSAIQRPAGRYSYSNYDDLGRVVESGEYTPGQYAVNVFENHLTITPASNSVLQSSILENRTRSGGLYSGWFSQRQQVWYDLPFQDAQLNGRVQEFTLGAVSKTSNDKVTTWYSFDELGRVTWVVQDIIGVGVKTLDYTYDFSGNVLEVAYQTGQPDAFRHYYEYDAAQRLYKVYTSPDGVARTLQAKYFYYLHGPLKRVELANRLQGLDYTYTLQGWLKSINHINERLDPGADSPAANGIPKDLFALTLDYFSGDYRSRSLNIMTPTGLTSTTDPYRYDGTIRASAWRTTASPDHHQMVYAYDEKSQLKEASYGKLGISGAYYHFDTALNKGFGEGGLGYDQNGNIQSLRRTDQAGAVTDNFTYKYAANTNKLTEVHSGGAAGPTVLDYDYDALGQMTRQRDEQGQRYLTYNVSGKTTGVYLDAAHQQPVVEFAYDDRGFRVSKKSYGTGTSASQVRTTYYVRDVAGNVLSVYEQGPQTGNAVQRSEVPLYGSGRVGTLTRLDDGSEDYRYELTDNLGDARVVFHKPTTETLTETMELSGVSSRAAFQNNNRYRATLSGAPSGSYVAQFSGSQAAGTELKRTLTVEKGDTITFTAQGLLQTQAVAGPTGARVQPYLLLGAIGLSDEVPTRSLDGQPTVVSNTSSTWLGRVAAGLSFTLGQHQKEKASVQLRDITTLQGWIRYRVLDAQGAEVSTRTEYLAGASSWETLRVGVRVQQGGTVEVIAGSTGQGSSVYFDNLAVEQTGSMIVQEQHQYAYGSPLVGLNYTVGNKRYRYGYQGQYAEKDSEIGFESFELRLYNDRIGRWTSYDPKGQFNSPYIGMGNNPVLNTDIDGGYSGPGLGAWSKIKGIFSEASTAASKIRVIPLGPVFVTAKKLPYIGKAVKLGVNVAHSVAKSYLLVGSSVLMPLINQGHIAWKEGLHDGSAYDSGNNVSWASPWTLDDNWALKQKSGMMGSDGDVAQSDGIELMQATTSVVMSRFVTVKVTLQTGSPIINTIGNTSIPFAKNGIASMGAQATIKNTFNKILEIFK